MAKKSPLGRGLGALIDNSKYEKKEVEEAMSTGAVAEIDIDKIEANKAQPRTEFDETALQELSDSIKQLGIIQPITVRKFGKDKYQIISGERRYRASKIAGLKKIIAYVRDANDESMLELALVENIQREDLNAIEVAISYQRLLNECDLTQDQLSERIGKKRSTITNYVRLLKLPAEVQAGLQNKQISMGHARALVNIEDPEVQIDTFYRIIGEDLSVRESEKLIREINYPLKKEIKKAKKTKLPEEYKQFQDKIAEKFPSKVTIKRSNAGKGSISFSFTTDEDFNKIKELLSKI